MATLHRIGKRWCIVFYQRQFFLIWVALATTERGLEGALRTVLFFLLPLVCIWFPDEVGSLQVNNVSRRIDEPSHPAVLRYASWVLLLLVPLGFRIVYAMKE